MRIAETKDIEEIKSVLFHPRIWEAIGGELLPSKEFNLPEGSQYVAGYVNNEIMALMIYTQRERLECHFQVLPEYRKEHAKNFARMALNFGKAKNVSIYAEIPDCYPNVLSFAKEFDFQEIGREESGAIINGVPHDVIILRRENGIC